MTETIGGFWQVIMVISLSCALAMLVLLLCLFGVELYFFRKRDPRSVLIRLGNKDN